MKRRLFLISSILLTLYLLPGAPGVASAHGGGREPAAAAGPLSWGFLGFGALVIVIVSFYLGSRMMAAGDFRTPFFLMAGFLLVAAMLFWSFFAGWEAEGTVAQVPSRLEAAPVGD